MKKIACLSALTLIALAGCSSNEKKSNMSVMSDQKQGSCCSENKDASTCTDKSADKSNMSVISEKKECTGDKASCHDSAKTCPATGQTIKQ